MNLIAGGFLLVKAVPRSEWMSGELLPSNICSASDCISPQFPSSSIAGWTQDTQEARHKYFEDIGIPLAREEEIIKWGTDNYEKLFGWPGIFYDLESAKAARASFFNDDKTISVLGLGLPVEFVEAFIEEASPPPPQPGFAPQGKSGYLEIIEKNEKLPEGGEFLGFELMVTDYGGQLSHSWICNSLEEHCASALSIKPASNGFLPDLETAKRCNEEISREDVGTEPGLWLPWAIVKY